MESKSKKKREECEEVSLKNVPPKYVTCFLVVQSESSVKVMW